MCPRAPAAATTCTEAADEPLFHAYSHLGVVRRTSWFDAAPRRIAQRLALHARQARRLRPGQALRRTRNRLHLRRSRTVRLPPGKPAKLRRRHVAAYRKPFATHRAHPSQVRP